MVEKRSAERKLVTIEAELVSGANRYKGRIENISLDGLYMRLGLFMQFATAPDVNLNEFRPASRVTIKFTIPSGEEFELECESMWINIYQVPPHSLVNQIGILITDPPEKLRMFVDTLPVVDTET